MNKKGQLGVGVFIMLAMAVIVAAIMIQASADNTSLMTTKVVVTDKTYTAATAGGSITLLGQAASDVVVVNATSGDTVPASNYTITNYVVSNGVLTTTLKSNAGSILGWQGKPINVSYTYEPFGYDTNSGGRAVAGLIIVFASLAIAVAVLTPVIREKIIDAF